MFYTALLLGLAGSLHCIGMCSPLVMMVSHTQPHLFWKRIIYNVGRIIPYGLLGAMAGAFGSVLQFPWLQFWLTLIFGVAFLMVGLTGAIHSFSFPWVSSTAGKLVIRIKILFSKFFLKKTWSSFFILGTLNGFIPCGLTYIATSYCFLLPSALDGFLFMIIFGLGTLPAMIGFPSFVMPLIQNSKLSTLKITSVIAIILGCSILARATFVSYNPAQKINAQVSVCK